jgi:hypothetical protein
LFVALSFPPFLHSFSLPFFDLWLLLCLLVFASPDLEVFRSLFHVFSFLCGCVFRIYVGLVFTFSGRFLAAAVLFHGVFRRLRWFWRFVLVSEALALC